MKLHRILALGCALSTMGCLASTESTEVGVRTINISALGGRGVQPEIYSPGGTYFFLRTTSDWQIYGTEVQNLSMTSAENDAVEFKTVDGNDISVDVIIAWRILPQSAPYLAQFVGSDTEEVGAKLVRPVARTMVRDVLNQLTSEEYYQADRRFQMARLATERVNQVLETEGVTIDTVQLQQHRFNTTYEQMIRDKKLAEQEAERISSEIQAVRAEMEREYETALGLKATAIAQAEGAMQRRKLEGDALVYEKVQEAEGIRAEMQAKADALIEQAKALRGSGGRNMVKLKVAEQLRGKKILFLPAGDGMDLRTTDLNALLAMVGVKATK